MDLLPVELLHVIASFDVRAYKNLLAIPFFARSLNPSIRTDYMIEFGYSVKITKYSIEWYRNGERHRDNGPAIEFTNGTKCWYLNGEYHREDGPAVEYSNGYKIWYLNGKEVGPF